MTWDGKKAEPTPRRIVVCAGCRKPGGTLRHVAEGRFYVHPTTGCMNAFTARLSEERKESVA